jgi:hypothetical protein
VIRLEMPPMRKLFAAVVLACVSLLPAAAADDSSRAEGYAALNAAALDRLRSMMGELRGRPFVEPVPVETLTRDQSREFLRRKMRQEYPPEAIAAEEISYRHFGLLGPTEELEALFVELMVERAAGFYDPEARRLFIVEGQPWAGLVLAHELAHALQDQMFGIDRMLRASRGDDDRLRAVQAMIEGEAMWLAGRLSSRRAASRILSDVRPTTVSDGRAPAAAAPETAVAFPAVLQAELSFPYTSGLAWAEAIASEPEGPVGMDAWFREPPDSTEQILHPDRAREPRDRPDTPPRRVLPDLGPEGWRLVKANTWGGFGVRLVVGGVEADGGVSAAAGWDGDLFGVYEAPGQRTALVWVSIWDSERDAAEAQRALEEWLSRRHATGEGFSLERRGRRLALAEGLDPGLSAKVLGQAWNVWDEGGGRP